MIRTVYLHGHLKKQFGPSHRFDVATAAEALRALNCAFPGKFVEALQTGSYKLVRGAKATGLNISADMQLITELKLGLADLHLIPVAKGAANTKGVVKTVLGVALIGAAIFAAPSSPGGGSSCDFGCSFGKFTLGTTFATLGGVAGLAGLITTLTGFSAHPERVESGPIVVPPTRPATRVVPK